MITSPLYEARVQELPPLPLCLQNLNHVPEVASGTISEQILELFPYLSRVKEGSDIRKMPLKVGVVLSGGQAPGGHNVINGLLNALQRLNPESQLIGFINGPKGITENQFIPLKRELVHAFLNTGGFDMIGSGRTKIETSEQFKAALETVKVNGLDGLVIIGGDDSNTNAALLAEYFLANNHPTTIVGVPKTIDGDLKNHYIEQSFGFDTAVKVYSEIIGNLLKDTLSAKKYWYFIKLMGRSASHITLECALQTRPNLTLISEERRTLNAVVDDMVELIQTRAILKKNYGAILIPEGIIEFIPELPKEALQGVSYDSHGNLEVSKIESERLFIDLVKKRLGNDISFEPKAVFLGYEGRSAYPSYFDACYCYALGHVAALLVAKQSTGRMATVHRLKEPVSGWGIQGIPLIDMLTIEMRKGVLKPVIAKSLVELDSLKYQQLKNECHSWRLEDCYRSPGPIQFWGPRHLVETSVL